MKRGPFVFCTKKCLINLKFWQELWWVMWWAEFRMPIFWWFLKAFAFSLMGISCFLGYFDHFFPKIIEKFNFFSFLDEILLILLNFFEENLSKFLISQNWTKNVLWYHFKMVGSNHKTLICTHKMLAKLDTKMKIWTKTKMKHSNFKSNWKRWNKCEI